MWQCLFQPGARVSVRVKWHLLFPEVSTSAWYLFACQGRWGCEGWAPRGRDHVLVIFTNPCPSPGTWEWEASVHLAGLASDHRLFLSFPKPLLFSSDNRDTNDSGRINQKCMCHICVAPAGAKGSVSFKRNVIIIIIISNFHCILSMCQNLS